MPLPTLNHQTPEQFLARIRDRYAQSQGEQTALIAKKLVEWLPPGDPDESKARAAFGKDVAAWATFRSTLQSQAALLNLRGS